MKRFDLKRTSLSGNTVGYKGHAGHLLEVPVLFLATQCGQLEGRPQGARSHSLEATRRRQSLEKIEDDTRRDPPPTELCHGETVDNNLKS